MSQFPRTNEKQRGQSQGTLDDEVALVAIDRPKKGSNLLRVRDRRMMLSPGCGKAPSRSADGSRSALPVATAYRKTWPAIVRILCAVSRAPRLSTRRRPSSKFGGLDLRHGPFSDPGEKVTLQAAHDGSGMPRRPGRGKFRMPFAGDDLKGFCLLGLCLLLCLADSSGVDAVCNLPTGFIPSLSGIGKGYFRISTKGKKFLFSLEAILQPP